MVKKRHTKNDLSRETNLSKKFLCSPWPAMISSLLRFVKTGTSPVDSLRTRVVEGDGERCGEEDATEEPRRGRP